jgi:hypothetical protein
MILTEENLWFFHHSSLAIVPAESFSSKQEEWAKEIMNLALQSIFVHTTQSIFTCHKILRHGSPALLSCCGFLLPLKIHRPGRV